MLINQLTHHQPKKLNFSSFESLRPLLHPLNLELFYPKFSIFELLINLYSISLN